MRTIEIVAGFLLLGVCLEGVPTAGAETAESADTEQDQAPDGRALFLANCARCHGENGDGKGVTELDRPARSFQDGGFSYGNTVDAIVRTITNGIPGTPMPAFEGSSTSAERVALAEFVIAFGPPGLVVDPKETVLVVQDRPLVVRGYLPPIAEGAPEHPRGLLIGTTDGLTFEYRVDDVRLLGVRAGPFVERRDWIGRGGDPLLPLGMVVHLVEGGQPRATFTGLEFASGPPPGPSPFVLEGRLSGTWVDGERVGLEYWLMDGSARLARIRESVRAVGTSVASGFERVFTFVECAPSDLSWGPSLHFDALESGTRILERFDEEKHPAGAEAPATWLAAQEPDGTTLWYRATTSTGSSLIRVDDTPTGGLSLKAIWMNGACEPGASITLTVLSGGSYAPEDSVRLIEELRR